MIVTLAASKNSLENIDQTIGWCQIVHSCQIVHRI
jgi:hypothetical protein